MKQVELNRVESEEQLLVLLIDHMADTFGPQVILRGGMVLRLLDSPRETNDLDYAFTGFTSKKQIVSPITESLKDYEGLSVEHSLHSTAVRFDIILNNDHGTFHVLIEAKIVDDCPTIAISTGSLAQKYHLEPQVILTMKHEVSLANKLAAWVERRLVRDLYDAYYYYRFHNIRPDLDILTMRLNKLNYFDKSLRKSGPKTLTLIEFCDLLNTELQNLDSNAVQTELVALGPNMLPGLEFKIRAALLEIVDWIRDNQTEITK